MNVSVAVPGVASGATDQASSTGSNSIALDPDMFLKLLISEIKNQDPTKPMDSAALVQQLAAFSQVQLSTETNARLESMAQALSLGQAAALVGRGLIAADGTDLGIAEAVRFTGEGLVARLGDGSEVALDQSVTIRK